ncbi:Fe-S cluster assembly protein SufD [Ligilactobacillus ceti]|uniref:Iron sulfur ABC transporter n=1 Tax=Ligilactobacillus ceti DSM 22408 TaxID=1122146 RepID=A0A0R2KI55_9LACO|nr:Fe-S cluster assembly protein SufD [Ligilactobacillus ceti]KRN88993.1 iron sulfur ABC transporter [Ligilactobacillus ceti DSM 22408]
MNGNQRNEINYEPQWFQDLRTAAQQQETQQMPAIKKVKFKRWNLHVTQPQQHVADQTKLAKINLDQNTVNTFVQFGSQTTQNTLSSQYTQQGVIMCDFQTALQEHEALVRKYYQKSLVQQSHQLLNEHQANFQNGLFIYIPKNVNLQDVLTSYLIQDATIQQDYVTHVLLVVDENSEVNYLENLMTIGSQKTTANIVVEVIAKANSKVTFTSCDQLGAQTTTYLNRTAQVAQDATVTWSTAMLNDGHVLADFKADLIENGAQADLQIVALATGKQTQGIDTKVNNKACYTQGHILQHGAILGKATLTFNGIGHVFPKATGSDAQQESRVLMLTPQAKGNANPILLIDHNDVTAGHAASVGRVDEDQMYYLMSRGLSKEVAQKLVVLGFFGPVLAKLPSQNLKDQMLALLERKMQDD